ncbi:GNAT family N-acetyltransferase [Bartonella rattaustraliani]|uniref:GNAT family N-acetyltransferase n=1 Tax=Bartonella rattaustraliani TaxID=481139 RepID=UPI000307C653|nr:GNAT family protein [Bartonella rattaustraliani]
MRITDLPHHFVVGRKVRLLVPDVSYSQEMYTLLSEFLDLHYEFLLWANMEHSIELCSKNLETATKNFLEDKNEYRFLMVESHSDCLLGCISLFIKNPKISFYEIGCWISNLAMGAGIVTEACILVKNIACHYLHCKRLKIQTVQRNTRNTNVAIRAGFQLEARLKNHCLDGFGSIDDTCIYTYPI